jgi:glycosyltransferase involved in cell wall biosynthesis
MTYEGCRLMDTPFFSIIVPVYNTKQYLKRCVDSLLGQTFSAVEVICVDDGSADNSPAILESCHDERLRIIRQDHGGVSRARNRGLLAARGSYILFTDSDDYVSVDMCRGLYRIIAEESPDLVVFGGRCFYHESFRDDGGFWAGVSRAFNDVLTTRNIRYTGNSIRALFHEKGSHNTVWTKCIKRGIIEKYNIRFSETLQVAEDRTFCFCLFPCVSHIVFTAEKYYFYQRNRPGSATGIFFQDNYPHEQQNFQSMVEVYVFWESLRLFPQYRDEFIRFFRPLLFSNILSIENKRQREDEARRRLDFFINRFDSYALDLIMELHSPPRYDSIFTLLGKAIRVLRKDGFVRLVRKALKYLAGPA